MEIIYFRIHCPTYIYSSDRNQAIYVCMYVYGKDEPDIEIQCRHVFVSLLMAVSWALTVCAGWKLSPTSGTVQMDRRPALSPAHRWVQL